MAGLSHLWRERHPLASRTLAIPVVLTLILDVASKSAANMAEVLWSCYWASALIAIGLIVDSELLVSAGFIFQAAVGGPAWTLGMIYHQDVQSPSVLLHVIPPLAGLLYVSSMPEIPQSAAAIAWLVHPVSVFASLVWRNDQLNVNFSNAVWPPVAGFFRLPVFQALLVITSLLLVLGLSRLLDSWLRSQSGIVSVDRHTACVRRDHDQEHFPRAIPGGCIPSHRVVCPRSPTLDCRKHSLKAEGKK